MDSQEPRFAPDSAAIRINLGSTDLAPLELTFKAFLLTDVEEANKHLDSIQSHSVVGPGHRIQDRKRQPTPRRAKLCVVQIAIERRVYVLDMTAMQTCPEDLRRILEDPTICSGPRLHVNARSFRDIGHMARIAFPIYYRKHANPLSMQRCVGDILHRVMDKTDQKADWHLGLTDTTGGRDVQKLFATPPSTLKQVSRDSDARGKSYIPGEWLTYDCVEGKAMRIATDINDKYVEWIVQHLPMVCLRRVQ
ncbi:hypothetical protein R3P38DRAFT_3211390 [Favolaschia claudopus]|uniref:Uncharacterized protein n=1 Tax=Favolaschia claudopus TaxID=2862362 RepID=A0AAW0AG91_9AGAR